MREPSIEAIKAEYWSRRASREAERRELDRLEKAPNPRIELRWPGRCDSAYVGPLTINAYRDGAILEVPINDYEHDADQNLSVEQLEQLGRACLLMASVLRRRL